MHENFKKHFFFYLFSLAQATTFVVVLIISCQKLTEPLYNPANLQLQVLDVSCTETWLSLKAKNDFYNQTLKLYQGDSLVIEKTLTTEDSILLVEDLWPNTQYQFKASVYDGNNLLGKSATVTATTMDTTSHNFEWQTFEFGGQSGSSSFYDVAIIDENDIWAVGEIYTENDKYNAAHWDGEKWELKKITYGGWFWTINTVFAFSHNDVWFSAFVKWNGSRFVEYPVPNVLTGYGLNKMWGTSSKDLYVVGNNGLIAHYDGHRWQRIESGTELDFRDIWGVYDRTVDEYEILALASTVTVNIQESRIYKIRNYQVKELDNTGLSPEVSSLWFIPNKRYYVVGAGIHQKRKLQDSRWKVYSPGVVTRFLSAGVRGCDINNVIVVGSFGEIVHFNGISWYNYYPQISLSYGVFGEVSVQNNIIVAVGFNSKGFGSYAVILIGRK